MRYVNTALSSRMLPDGDLRVGSLSSAAASAWLQSGPFHNLCNPTHGNTLDAFSRVLNVDLRAAAGGQIRLAAGDACLVLEVSNLPRETREFQDDEIASATFAFRLVEVR